MRTLNIAHRGFSGEYPENTMRAFLESVKVGCDGIETDVQMTKDGILVICHDEIIDRTTNGSGYINDYNYDELSEFDSGIKYGEEFAGEKIPTLDNLFEFVKDKDLLINIELKNNIINYNKMEEKVIEKVYEYNLINNVILSSFNHYSMVKVKEIDNKIKTGLLYMSKIYKVHEYAKRCKADAIHPLYLSVLSEEVVKEVHNEGISINAWTVDNENDMKKLMGLGIDGIITNYPNRLNNIIEYM